LPHFTLLQLNVLNGLYSVAISPSWWQSLAISRHKAGGSHVAGAASGIAGEKSLASWQGLPGARWVGEGEKFGWLYSAGAEATQTNQKNRK